MKIKSALDRIGDALDKVCSVLIVLMLGAMVIITAAQIVCRTWFTALTWSDEVTRYLLIWSTFLGSTVVYRHSGNIAITILQEKVPAAVGKVMRILTHVVCFVLFAILLTYSVRYCGKLNKTATTPPIKMRYIYTCIPVSMGVLMFHAFNHILAQLMPSDKEVKA